MLKTLLQPVFAHPKPYLKGLFQWFLIALGEIAIIIIIQHVAKEVQFGSYENLPRYAWYFLLILVVSYGGKFLTKHRRRPNMQSISESYLRKKYFTLLVSIDSSYLEKIGTGRLIDIIQQGISFWRRTLETIVQTLPDIGVKLIFSLYIISQMGRLYATGYITFLIIVLWVSNIVNKYALTSRKGRKNIEMSMSRRLVRFLMSRIEVLHSDTIEKEVTTQLEDIWNLNRVNKHLNYYLHLMYNIPIIAVQLLVFLIILYTIKTLKDGTFSYATFTGMMAVIGFLLPLIISYMSRFKDLTKDFIHVEKLWESIDHAPKMINYNTGKVFTFLQGDISLTEVEFSYQDGTTVFKNFSLDIQGGKKTALVGRSGSGKTTLVKLLSGLIRPDEGKVLIDKQDLSVVSLKSFFKHIGLLQQEPIVFDGTIRENIEYGLGKALSDEQMRHVLQQANAEFVLEFREGLETEVGERGIRLSGGQKQRLAIARIFAKNPDIILLDEPTSALDSFAEEAITEAMYKLFEGRTVIIIAHRLQTVKSADEIIVLEDGQVIERGTHKQLTKTGGYYAKMLELQAGF